jgi:hypothetical protein
MRRGLAILFTILFVIGCAKRQIRSVAADDDEHLDQLAAQLEEIKARVQAQEPTCSEWCPLAKKVCDISRTTCDISARHPDRKDIQTRCSATQEDCAKFNDSCTGCGKL